MRRGWGRGGALALALTLALGACAASSARPLRLSQENWTEVRGQALPTCREAWAQVPPAQRTYDFTRDAHVTEQGNIGYQGFAERLPRQRCAKEWTVLIYMEADNQDLPPLAYWQLHEMEAFSRAGQSGASTLDADVVVQLDLDRPSGIRRLHVFGVAASSEPRPGPAAFKDATPRDIRSPIVELLPEDNDVAAPEEELAQFLRWGVTSYPARHYWVVVWGHGMGWRPRMTASGQPVPPDQNITNGGIGLDDHPGTVLDVTGLREALAAVSREDLGGRPFDVLATDACLMQSVEVLAELGGVARYAIGSEQIENYLGLPYRLLLPRINGSAGAGPPPQEGCMQSDVACRFATLVPAEMARSLRPGGPYAEIAPDAREPLTESVLDLNETGRLLVPALRQLSAALSLWTAEEPLRKITLQDVLLPPQGPGALGGLRRTPDFQGGMRDLGVLLDRLERTVEQESGTPSGATATTAGTGAGQKVLTAIAAVRSALGQTVLMAAFGTRYQTEEYVGMAGVSIWVPITGDDYQSRGDFFAASPLYAAPPAARKGIEQPWRMWLDTLYQ
ncbi:MAG TPA: clostripain-related cysteine peptidase [Polyangia bacterium]|nr:clostripain-related cysteine peptidase [Polyangia bacterium]